LTFRGCGPSKLSASLETNAIINRYIRLCSSHQLLLYNWLISASAKINCSTRVALRTSSRICTTLPCATPCTPYSHILCTALACHFQLSLWSGLRIALANYFYPRSNPTISGLRLTFLLLVHLTDHIIELAPCNSRLEVPAVVKRAPRQRMMDNSEYPVAAIV
jgi:hypothetical protein